MIAAQALVPAPVVVPLAVAAILLAIGHIVPARVSDITAIVVALFVAVVCGYLAVASRAEPLVYWFGGWKPTANAVLGIGFRVDPASAAIATFVAFLFTTTYVYAWGFFEQVRHVFHVISLVFLAALEGFCLTGDLFDLFVWFEVMSVAAFALTAYQLQTSSISGALNFTVTNSLASIVMLTGVGLVYGVTGSLNFAEIGRLAPIEGVRGAVLLGGFCLLALALLTKAAIVPMHFWLSDAHAVAPSPVSVVFSGAMVPIGLFAFAKISVQMFGGRPDIVAMFPAPLMALGCLTLVVGAAAAWQQRHLKRMLAFSTISHMGAMLVGLASLTSVGLAGQVAYLVGHGLVKAALFMLVGILPATRASVDELDLRGLGGDLWPAGLATAAAGLLLAGAPLGILHGGTELVGGAAEPLADGGVKAAMIFAAAVTGGSVLRAAGRVYLGWGPDPGPEANAPSAIEQESANRPLWLMLMPALVLLAADLTPASWIEAAARASVPALAGPAGARALASGAMPAGGLPHWTGMILAVLVAGWALGRDRLPAAVVRGGDLLTRPFSRALGAVHSGILADYVVWMMVGLALLAAFAI